MTAPSSIGPADFLHEHLAQSSPDLMRQMLTTFIKTLLSADADAVCGAAWGQVSDTRTTQRNGYRHRDLDTRTGTLDVAIPKLRAGTYFPEWLLERRRRAEAALTSAPQDFRQHAPRAGAPAPVRAGNSPDWHRGPGGRDDEILIRRFIAPCAMRGVLKSHALPVTPIPWHTDASAAIKLLTLPSLALTSMQVRGFFYGAA